MRFIESATRAGGRAKAPLMCGVLIAPIFFTVVFIQAFSRYGFDIRRAPLSLLSLGDLGWIQITNFISSGMLALACAAGVANVLRGKIGRTWGPRLIVTYGLGLILAGIFHPDPGYSFPPGVGAPARMSPTLSGHATVHALGFLIVVVSLIAACFVFTETFRSLGWKRWSYYSATTGLAALILLVAGVATDTTPLLTTMAVITFGWLSGIAALLLTTHRKLTSPA